jgi:amino acid adenylation domain-containing protein
VRDSANRFPGATAVVMGEERLTYAELDRCADWLASALFRHGCRPADRVCLLAQKSPVSVAAMIATLRAGCVCVPIDVSGPVGRTGQIVASAQPAAAFVGNESAALLDSLAADRTVAPGLPVIDMEGNSAGWNAEPPVQLPSNPTVASDPAQLLFTSGSTGRPKGVIVTHASARAYIDWAIAHFDIRPGDRCSGHPPLHFDLSTFDVYATLAAGGELHLLPPNILLPRQFVEYIQDSELHQLFCVPSAMAYLSAHDALPDGGFPSLRRILWCGEVLPTPVLIEWMTRHPGARFENLYGPTEATIASSHHLVDVIPSDPSEPIPIGTACDGEELLILDDDGSPAASDTVGELCIAGVGLSPGYWRDPDSTAAAFISDPRPGRTSERIYRTGDLGRMDSEGTFHFVGRSDSQIKHRGYRIELGEIESAVSACSAVAECAVVALPAAGFEGTTICCAAALRTPNGVVTPAQLRAALTERLPRYMLPTRWLLMDELPRNVNGKIDRREIYEQFASEIATR